MSKNRERYEAYVDNKAEVSRFTLIGLNGVTIYQEERDVSERGWQRLDAHNQMTPVTSSKSLIIEFPMVVSSTDFYHYERYTDDMKKTENGYELVMIHDSAFSRPILNDLERKGYIKRICKTYPKAKGEYPIYINPRGWQIAYNLGSEILSSVHQYMLKKRKKEA